MQKINKNVLVTGAGKGIGEETVFSLLENGAYVYALIKSKKDNKKFKDYKNVKIYNGNVNNGNLIKKILKDSRKDKRFISGLVNNAGIRFRKNFLKITPKDLKNVFETNFLSIFNTMQIFSRFLIANKKMGSIVNISSIVGKIGFSKLSAYASTKGALTALTKSFATEMADKNIRANSISPGFIKTSFYKKFKNNKKRIYKWTLSRIPLKRWGKPSEVSNLICFLLSEDSSYINGENINVDGGWLSS